MTLMTRFKRYLELAAFKAYAELRTESNRTYIGVLWWILDPIVYMAVFYLVFEVLFQRGGENFVVFLLVGLVFFRWFGNAVANAALSIKQGSNLMQQVYLPKWVFPLVTFISDTFKFSITVVLLLAFLWISGYPVTVAYLALPVLFVIETILSLGVLLLVAACVPLLPDIRFLVNHGLTLLLFLSGVFYSAERLSPAQQELFYLNPLSYLIEAYRVVLMRGQWPQWHRLWPALVLGSVCLLIACWTLWRLDRKYPKIVRTR